MSLVIYWIYINIGVFVLAQHLVVVIKSLVVCLLYNEWAWYVYVLFGFIMVCLYES